MLVYQIHTQFPSRYLTLFCRFILTRSQEDYESAMAPLDKIITSHSPAESPNQYLTVALSQAALIARTRFIFYGTPEYLQEVISHTHACLISTSPEDPKRGGIIQHLEELERTRLEDFAEMSTS